jgi:uncharacterized membrane protein YphA (DoxX/SURF4 family)
MGRAFMIGRLVVGCYYLFSGWHHFSAMGPLAGYASARGVPMPHAAVAVAGLFLIVAGLSLLLGFHPLVGVAAMAAFFVPVTLVMHAFWTEHDPAVRAVQVVNFTKNVALMGSGLMYLAVPRPWPYSVDQWRLHAHAHAHA